MVARLSRTHARRRAGPLRSIVGIALCIVVALAAYAVGRARLPEAKIERQRAFVPEFDAVEISVPDRPVPAGTLVRDISTRIEKFPEHQLPDGVIRDLSRVRDTVTLVGLPGGLPILEENLGSAEEVSNPVIGKIPPGMRAMTVHVDATSAVEGWARTGSLVDVLLIRHDRTTVVAEKVRVLSTEHSTSLVAEIGASSIPSTVTLLVTQEQCLAINTAVPLGKIAFALRSNRDLERWRSPHFSAEDLPNGDTPTAQNRVAGVVSLKVDGQERRFALVDRTWIPTEVLPEGFLRRPTAVEGERSHD